MCKCIEEIDNLIEEENRNNYSDKVDYGISLLNVLRERINKTEDDWILLKDKLPESGVYFLWYFKWSDIFEEGQDVVMYKKWKYDSYWYSNTPPDFWKPLPPAPNY